MIKINRSNLLSSNNFLIHFKPRDEEISYRSRSLPGETTDSVMNADVSTLLAQTSLEKRGTRKVTVTYSGVYGI